MKILIDMDGVICDLMDGICAKYDYNIYDWPEGKVIPPFKWHELDESFWLGLLPTLFTKELFQLVSEYETYICTSPPMADRKVASYKLEWIHNWFPRFDCRVILTNHKHLMANNVTTLIDDCDHDIALFESNGGIGCLVPQPWNRCHGEHPLKYVRELCS